MRVALFTETFLPQINGVVRTLEKIILHLEANGHEVLLFTIGEGEAQYSKSKIVRVEGVPFNLYKELYIVKPQDKWASKFAKNDFMQAPMAILQSLIPTRHSVIEEALLEFQPDIIHLATPVTLGAIGLYYVDKLNLPSIASYHTDLAAYAPMYQVPYFEEVINGVTKMIYSKVLRVLAPSPSSKKQLEGLGLKNVGVFGRGVDHELFSPAKRNREVLAQYGLDQNKITITYVGRLAEEKSIPELVAVFATLSEKYPIQLLIIGDGPIKQELEESLEKADGLYAFTGIKKGAELVELYASSDIFAFPSRTETFGQVVLEAMASGLPIVGYESPGVRDLVHDKKNGYLANSAKDFELCLESLIKDNNLRLNYAKKSRELSLERSWQNILDALLQEYKKLLK